MQCKNRKTNGFTGSRRRCNLFRMTVAISSVLLVVTCTTLSILVPRPRSEDDTLVVTVLSRSGSRDASIAFYRLQLIGDSGEVVVSTGGNAGFSFERGVPPGDYTMKRIEAVRHLQLPDEEIETGRPAGVESASLVPVAGDLDIPVSVRKGQVTIIPVRFNVHVTRDWHGNIVETTQVCTLAPMSSAEIHSAADAFFSRADARTWRDRRMVMPADMIVDADIPAIEVRLFSAIPAQDQPVCFPGGTVVQTPDGEVPIENLRVGDLVRSFDVSTGTWEDMQIVRTISREYTGSIFIVETETTRISVTGEHPFRRLGTDVKGAWIPARNLKAADTLLVYRGGTEHIRSIAEQHARSETVYNITVAGHHTYAVGMSGILVHNKGRAESP